MATTTFTHDGMTVGTSVGVLPESLTEADTYDPLEDAARLRVAGLRARLAEGALTEAMCKWERSLAYVERSFIGVDAVGRPDTVRDDWVRELVGDEVRRVVPTEPNEMVRKRTSALCGLVMQLGVAVESGSAITPAAVINVARAAFPIGLGGRALESAGIAGMCVMWAHYPAWAEAAAGDFDVAIWRFLDDDQYTPYVTYRPDDIAADITMTH